MKGWECPKCGKCHAPFVAHCDCDLWRVVTAGTATGKPLSLWLSLQGYSRPKFDPIHTVYTRPKTSSS